MTQIADKIFYLGINDRRKQLFENLWPLPYGVSYNSYLIADQKTVLIDTVEHTVASSFFDKLQTALNGRTLDYLVINHMEPDHAGAIGDLLVRYPNLKIVGNSKTFNILEAYFDLDATRVEVTDNSELDLGQYQLKFYTTPWLHWPETMMTYVEQEQILFTGDAFGSFRTLDGAIFDSEINFERDYYDEALRYYSNIVGKYSNMVQKALKKLENVPIKMICSTHGPIWKKNPSTILEAYQRWSSYGSEAEGVIIAFASMYGNTEEVADTLARHLAELGVPNIKIFDVSKTHPSFIISEIWKYKGVILGSSAYNSEMHPMMAQLCHELAHINPKNKQLSIFGSYSWSGGGVKGLQQFAEKIQWKTIGAPIELNGMPTLEKLANCRQLATEFVAALREA